MEEKSQTDLRTLLTLTAVDVMAHGKWGMREQMDSKLINVLAAGGKTPFKTSFLNASLLLNMLIQKSLDYKVWRDSTKHHSSPDMCNVVAYISVLEIRPLVRALSWEAPLRVKVYFQCAYLYSACLNRETKWSKIFPAIRPGNERLWQSQSHFHRETWTYPRTATIPEIKSY